MDAISLTRELVQRASITPDDGGCHALIAQLLADAGFNIRHLDINGVKNLWAQYGEAPPDLIFAGHSDVVPVGDSAKWTHPPFSAHEENGVLYGRGAADMKSGVAASVCAMIEAVKTQEIERIGFILTSDEEGPAEFGSAHVVNWLSDHNIRPRWCILAEPSSEHTFGDTVRVGRRGSLNANITLNGTQGHIAYPHLADNPIDHAAQVINALRSTKWDEGYPDFPETACQISNIHAGTGATNVIPGSVEIALNFRFNPASSVESLQAQCKAIIAQHCADYSIDWKVSGAPFHAADQTLIAAINAVCIEHLGSAPTASTGGGTSDGRFISQLGTAVIEFGVNNATIHQVNECVALDEIERLAQIYRALISRLAAKQQD